MCCHGILVKHHHMTIHCLCKSNHTQNQRYKTESSSSMSMHLLRLRLCTIYKRKEAQLLAILPSAYRRWMCENEGCKKSTCWSDLPVDIRQIICEKLVTVEDYIRFGAVSRLCRYLVWLSRKNVPHSQLPLLMSPYYCASSHGWVIYTRQIERAERIHLSNPFLSVNNTIQLPGLPVDTYVHKAVISHNPAWTTDYVIMAICTLHDKSVKLLFSRAGQESWEILNVLLNGGRSEVNINYYQDSFYIIGLFRLFSCDTSQQPPKITNIAAPPPPAQYIPGRKIDPRIHLVESLGELLCVVKEIVQDKSVCFPNFKTVGCRIFKLQTSGSDEWVELKTLSGQALFIGQFTSLAVQALDFPECKPNHVYFSNLDSENYQMSVFNLEDGSIHHLVGNKREALDWILPTMNMTGPKVSLRRVRKRSRWIGSQVNLRNMKRKEETPEEETAKARLLLDSIATLVRLRVLHAVVLVLILIFSLVSKKKSVDVVDYFIENYNSYMTQCLYTEFLQLRYDSSELSILSPVCEHTMTRVK